MFESIRRLFVSIGSWALPIKFLVSAALGAFAGAGVLGFLVEYATHAFALAFGFRPPVEGIPYLEATVTGGSLLLLVSGSFIAAAMIFLLQRGGVEYRRSVQRKSAMGPGRPENTRKLLMRALGGLLLTGVIALASLSASCKASVVGICSYIPEVFSFPFLGGIVFGALASGLTTWRPTLVWWFSIGTVVLYYGGIVFLLFSPIAYAEFLRYTGFGGGLPVTIAVETKHDMPPTEIKTTLMLRTSQALIVFDRLTNTFHEYPIERVARLSYATGGLHLQAFELPPLSGEARQ